MKIRLWVIAALAIPAVCLMLAHAADQPANPQPTSPKAATAPAGTTPAAPANGAPPAKAADPQNADDVAAIRASGAAFIEAYNARDAKKLAALWSPEAVYSDPLTGEEIVGREAIEQTFADSFADKQDAKLTVEVEPIDFVSPNVAILRGTAHVTRPGAEPEDSTFTSVRVKRDGQWLIDRVTEVEKEKAPPSNYEHLKELEWMIGSWHDDDPRPSVEIQTDCDWTKNRNFITRSFAFAIGDQVNKSGMQIIGWDPIAKQIHSWVFDSDGGYAEGTWTHKGNQWTVHNTGTLPDGSKATSTNIMTMLDPDAYKWESVNRTLDDEILPNVDPVLVIRKGDR